jgi:hypothetical protein
VNFGGGVLSPAGSMQEIRLTDIRRGVERVTPSPYALPLLIRKTAESFAVEDANGVALGYVYFQDESARRALVNRRCGADAKAVAQAIARALMDSAKSTN